VRWLALTVVLAGAALALHAMGRPWWCQAGDLVPWSLQVQSRHNSQHLVDAYSVTHAMHGLLFYWGLWLFLGRVAGPTTRVALALGIETTWELVENTNAMIERYRAATISLDYYGDSVLNSVADIVCFVVGYVAAASMPVWISVAAFAVAELLLLVWIRDSLLLNMLMLVHPVEAVKAWQLGG
jgi:uncharacterized protein DUF2585